MTKWNKIREERKIQGFCYKIKIIAIFNCVTFYILKNYTVIGDNMKRTAILLRLRPEDREVIQRIARYYDISEADVVKLLIREYMKNHKIDIEVKSS